ncbi:MAG: metal-sulfur cluster assembly factor [Lautropia sp.]
MTRQPYPYEGSPALRSAIDAALRSVVDPEVALNIVDVGLVYGVTADASPAAGSPTGDSTAGGPRVGVRLTMTSAACPVADVIVDDIELALETALPAGSTVDIRLVWEPPWTPERMSERARSFMGW